jgi:hypothetical protein
MEWWFILSQSCEGAWSKSCTGVKVEWSARFNIYRYDSKLDINFEPFKALTAAAQGVSVLHTAHNCDHGLSKCRKEAIWISLTE